MARDAALRLMIMTRDDATASLAKIEQGLARVGKQARTTRQEAQAAVSPKGLNLDVLASIPGLGSMMGTAGLVGLAGLAAKTTLELTRMGEESAQLEARFNAFAGGAAKGAANLNLMNQAVGGALTQDDKMIALNALMASGLTDTAEQAAKVAEAAVWLGDATRNPLERIDALTNALLSGRTKGLVPYGVDMDKLKARTQELQNANAGLSQSQATLNAFLEQAVPLMRAVQNEGGKAVTSTQALAVAWGDLKDEMGTVIAPIITPQIEQLTQNIRQIMAVGKTDPLTMFGRTNDYNDAIARRVQAEEQLAKAQRSGYGVEAARNALAAAQANEQVATSALNAALAAQQLGGSYRETGALANALTGAQTTLTGANYRVADSYLAIAEGIAGAGKKRAEFELTPSTPLAFPGYFAGEEQKTFEKELQALRLENARELTQFQIQRGREAGTAYGQAVAESSSRIKGFLDAGMGTAQGLLPKGLGGAGNPITDPNGPFRDLYRALDVAKLGEASPWAKGLGMTQEQGQKIAGDVRRGIISPEVEKLIDFEKLANEQRLAVLAEKTQAAFAAKIDALAEQIAQKIASVNVNLNVPGGTGAKPATGPTKITNNNTSVYAPTIANNQAVIAMARGQAVAKKVERISAGL